MGTLGPGLQQHLTLRSRSVQLLPGKYLRFEWITRFLLIIFTELRPKLFEHFQLPDTNRQHRFCFDQRAGLLSLDCCYDIPAER